MFLTLKDHDHIRLFVQEFTFRGLLPHIEKNIRQLNDQVCSVFSALQPFIDAVQSRLCDLAS